MYTVGILYPGDMGHSVARVLLEDDFAVVTTLVGRSERTRRLCASTAITVLDSMAAVVERADAVLSIIPPTAAKTVAADFAAAVQRTKCKPLFVEANAISPMAAQEVGEIIAQVGAPLDNARGHRGAGAGGGIDEATKIVAWQSVSDPSPLPRPPPQGGRKEIGDN